MTAPLSPPGSCPAHPQGPIADGTQLSDIVTKPFASGSGPAADISSPSATDPGSNGTHATLAQFIQIVTSPNTAIPPTPSAQPNEVNGGNCPSPASPTSATPPVAAPSSSSGGGFKLQNGLDAQSLNLKFSTLDPNSPCDGMYLRSSPQYNTTFNSFLFLHSYNNPYRLLRRQICSMR